MTQNELLQKIKAKLQELYGNRFRGLVLYGSTACGDAREDSDIDLLCLLDGPVDTIDEISPIVDSLSDIQDEFYTQVISVKAVDEADYNRGAYPLVIEARKEGVAV